MPSSVFRAAADVVVAVHLAFVVFVLLGGLLVFRWRWLAWLHVPAAIWGALIEYAGWICPLTPWENALRQRGGLAAYSGDFIGQYVLPLLYPERFTRRAQIVLGSLALAVNAIIYWHLLRARRPGP